MKYKYDNAVGVDLSTEKDKSVITLLLEDGSLKILDVNEVFDLNDVYVWYYNEIANIFRIPEEYFK